METVEKLIQYAIYENVLFDVSGKIKTPSDFNLNAVVEKGEELELGIRTKEKGIITYKVSLSEENQARATFIKALRRELPVVEVIDLIYFAISSKIDSEGKNGIVDDLTEGKNFQSYNNDYIELTTTDKIFKFAFHDELDFENVYKITFNMGSADIRKNIEFASRPSQFVDILIKKIMSKYNILIVRKASAKKTTNLPLPAIEKGFSLGKQKYDDIDSETSTLQSRMTVLIRYRDTVKNQTFSETVIDDIDITFEDGKTEPNFDYFDIVPGKSGSVYGELEEVSDEEIQNIVKAKRYMDDKNGKYRVFDVLRTRPEGSNLKKLIESRIPAYEQSDITPKVEFTLTPLTIYSNHIAVRTVKYPIISTRKDVYFKDVSCEYTKEFDPTVADEDIIYTLDVDGTEYIINSDNPLVMAVTNNFVRESKLGSKGEDQGEEQASNNKHVEVRVGCKETTVNLYEANPKYYGTEIYKDVYFDKAQVVFYDDGASGLAAQYKDDGPFLKSDLRRCPISKKLYFGYTYGNGKQRDMDKRPLNRVILKSDDDCGYRINLTETKPCFVAKKFIQQCEYCGEKYAATAEIWKRYNDYHKLINSKKAHCCDKCANEQRENQNNELILHDPRGFYFTTNNKLDSVMYCPVCKISKTEKYLYKGTVGDKKDELKECSICNQICCKTHITKIGKKYVCDLCAGSKKLFSKSNAFNSSKDYNKLWRKVKPYMSAFDKSKKICKFVENGNELYVYSEHKGHTKVYYFWKDAKNKNLFLKKKQRIKED